MNDVSSVLSIVTVIVSACAALYSIWHSYTLHYKLRSSVVNLKKSQSQLVFSLIRASATDVGIAEYLDGLTKAIASSGTGDIDCSIKLIVEHEGDKKLVTILRDQSSKDREVLKHFYAVSPSTIFGKAVTDRMPVYIADVQTPGSANEGNFQFEASKRKRVHSVLVAPILSSQAEGRKNVVGVLTVESTKANAFPENTVAVVTAASETLAALLRSKIKASTAS